MRQVHTRAFRRADCLTALSHRSHRPPPPATGEALGTSATAVLRLTPARLPACGAPRPAPRGVPERAPGVDERGGGRPVHAARARACQGGAPGAGAPPRLRSPSPGAARQQASEHGAPWRGPRRWLGPRCSEARREGASLGGAARRARAARQRSPGVLTPGLCPVSGLSGLQTHPPAFRWRVSR